MIGAATRVADVAADAVDRRALRRARAGGRARGVAAAAQSGHGRGQPRPARALLVLPPPRPDLLAGRRRHLLRADRRPPQARPRGRGLHLGRALRPRRRRCSRSTRACTSPGRAGGAACPSPSSTRARARGTAPSLQLARGELITAVELPAAARRLRLRARRRARGLVVRAHRHRRRALRRHGAPGRDRHHERAAPARPRRSAAPACPASSRPAGSASSRACCASARSPASRRDNPRVAAYDVAVIGAGTTGSSIAYFLTQRGLRPVVLREDARRRRAVGRLGRHVPGALQPSRRSSTWRSTAASSWPT